MFSSALRRYLPVLDWGRTYNKASFSNDMIAAVIVTIMLIPQSLAYALLAGLPPEAGLYASILPIMLYAIFGTSRALAVGPVAVVSLMTAAAIGQVAEAGTAGYAIAALTLAMLSGGILLLMGVFKLGFLANFLSHPVIAGFITASGILIASSQLKHILGVDASGHTLVEIVVSIWQRLGDVNPATLVIGVSATLFLFWVRKGMKPMLLGMGLKPRLADVLTKAGPVAAVVVTTAVVWLFGLQQAGVSIVGAVPQSLPPLSLPSFSAELIGALFVPALLISIIGFVESVSVAQTLAAKKRQRIDPDQELIGLALPIWVLRLPVVIRLPAGLPAPWSTMMPVPKPPLPVLTLRWSGDCCRLANAADLLSAQGDAGCNHHRGGAVSRGLQHPQAQLELFQA